ncbi:MULTISPECIES: nickel-dependent hydrogenase large subunit [unclassified Clostridium]|uniref:hydrogenase large subunit n=1 Tax=Clostridium TaxID=1485 RepID=UPI001C8BCC69|nr:MULTISPECIES: nickel-dependent hydrogenase large subunit [unclassified Clostridium]MBX9136059.1 NADH-quinone oxidoreductase subunit D [Clostridium sp. K12(2020)]MBX9142789.1 NADH-quinone oxidoreductase subunit D [Clostridium sp. K13]
MSNRSIIPFGPQHPVLPEPIHLDLVLEDEKVVEAIPTIGFVHRGLEKLVEKKDFQEYVFVAERICGICSFIHGMGYSQAVEKVMDIKIPERAEYLRVLWAELSRIHSHVLWLGLLSDALGFESLFMQCFRIREKVLNIFEMTTGGRVIFSVCKVGGVRKDINLEKQKVILNILKEVEKELKEIEVVFFDDLSVKKRLVGVGVLSKEEAYELGCVGPMARASGIDYDARNLGYSAYKDIEFKTIIDNKGDSYSRCVVRFKEIFESINIIRQVIDRMPDGEISIKVNGNPNGEYFARLEQPRGEVIYHIKGNGTKFLGRMRVRTPTFANMPALFKILQGCDLADVPILILTIDPCISCTER